MPLLLAAWMPNLVFGAVTGLRFHALEHDDADRIHPLWEECRIRKTPLFDRFIY